MRKIIVIALTILLSFQGTVSAFEIKSISPDTSEISGRNIDVMDDKAYLKSIADKYANLFVVEEKEYIDISEIDKFYSELSNPISLEELDSGKINFNVDVIADSELKKRFSQFKILGGLSGYTIEFEPVMYFNIYRDISLVGGYSCYTKTYENPDDASWIYITSLESMTKEILGYNTRIELCKKMKDMDNYISNDNKFKIFLLKGGKIDSVWERDAV